MAHVLKTVLVEESVAILGFPLGTRRQPRARSPTGGTPVPLIYQSIPDSRTDWRLARQPIRSLLKSERETRLCSTRSGW